MVKYLKKSIVIFVASGRPVGLVFLSYSLLNLIFILDSYTTYSFIHSIYTSYEYNNLFTLPPMSHLHLRTKFLIVNLSVMSVSDV